MSVGYTLFDTAIGRCGLAWGEAGLRAVQLPMADAAQTRRTVHVPGPFGLPQAGMG